MDPLQESEVWMEENWEMLMDAELGATIISTDTKKQGVSDPLGIIKSGLGRKVMSQDVLQQLGSEGN